MKRILLVAILLTNLFSARGQYKKYNFQQPKMGSPFNIILYAEDSIRAAHAAQQAFQLVDTLNQVYSDYLPNSELNQLCSTAGSGNWVTVSPVLYSILVSAKAAGNESKGSFDITLSPVIRIWRNARRLKMLPSKESIGLAMQKVGYQLIDIDTLHKMVRLTKPGMQLDLGGIAKGETAQRVSNRLTALGFPFALIDACCSLCPARNCSISFSSPVIRFCAASYADTAAASASGYSLYSLLANTPASA